MESNINFTLSAFKFICGETTHVCRLCFASTENQEICIEDIVRVQSSYFDESVMFLDMLQELGVPNEALLPQVLCEHCAASTMNSYLYQKLCQYSNEKWTAAFNRLNKSLSKTNMINPNAQTAYLIVNNDKTHVFTSKKSCKSKNKTAALSKVKNVMSAKRRYKKKITCQTVICEECGETCSSNNYLIKHMKRHNKVKKTTVSCPQCARSFATKLQVLEHAERVHYTKNIQCPQCDKMFSTMKMLKRHEKLYHIAAICKLCCTQFPSQNALRGHMDKHDVNKCPKCNKTLINKHSFKMHLKMCGDPSTKQLVFFCDICNKGYSRKNSLRSHLKTSHGFGQVYTCNWCSKKYDAISKLKNHTVKHTRERNYYCEHCGGRFVTPAALMYHVRLHTGERPFPCDLCNETFLSASRRSEHKRRKHFEPTKECPVCRVKFVTSHQLKKHVQRHYNPHSKLYVPVSIEKKLGADLDHDQKLQCTQKNDEKDWSTQMSTHSEYTIS